MLCKKTSLSLYLLLLLSFFCTCDLAKIGKKEDFWQPLLPIHGFIAKSVAMEVKVKIDKFGRVLIPKKIREMKGYRPGTELSLVMEPEMGTITMTSMAEKEAKRPVLQLDEFGIPTFVFDTEEVFTYDFAEAIRKDRSDRGIKNEEG